MMIQQLSAQSADVSSVKTKGTTQERNTDQFYTMLQTAAQKTTSKANEKGKSTDKTRNKTQKENSPDKAGQAQTDAVQAVQSILQDTYAVPSTVISSVLNEANSIIQDSELSESNLTPELTAEALQMLDADSLAAADEKTLFEAMEQANNTAFAETGTQPAVVSSAPVSAEGQIFEEQQKGVTGSAVHLTNGPANFERAKSEILMKFSADQLPPASGVWNATNPVIQDSEQSQSNLTSRLSVEALQIPYANIKAAAGEKTLSNGIGQANNTVFAQTGTQPAVVSSAPVSAEGQILKEQQKANDNGRTAYQTDSESNSSRADAELPIKPLGKQAAQVEGENIQTRQNQNIVTVQQNAQTEIQEEIPPSSVRSDTGENPKTKSIFSEVKHAEGNDGTVAAEGLSDLYNSGNVVIRVSDQMGQTRSSPIQQIADAAVYQMQNGKKEFTMELYPKSLGKVSVKLISHSGMLTVEIAASNPKTQSLILSGSAEIRNILQAATAQNVQTVIPNQQAAQWYDQPQNGKGGNSDSRRRKQENSRRHGLNGIASVSSELNTEDFLIMMQQIGAYAR